MANLWRILALSWLGGVASPILMDDLAIADALARPVAAAVQPAGDQTATEGPNSPASSEEETGGAADAKD